MPRALKIGNSDLSQGDNMESNSILIMVLLIFFAVGECFSGTIEVLDVVDGDTFLVKNGKEIKYVALYGLDAPEIGQPYSEDAEKLLDDIISSKKYDISINHADVLGVESCEIYYKGQNVACMLLSKGLAFYDKRIKNSRLDNSKYINSEKFAKKSKIGIWSVADIEYPEDYREKHAIIEEESEQMAKQINASVSAFDKVRSQYLMYPSNKYANYSECYNIEKKGRSDAIGYIESSYERDILYDLIEILVVGSCNKKFSTNYYADTKYDKDYVFREIERINRNREAKNKE